MSTLPTNLRRQLEKAIDDARKIAKGGARKALEALAVHEPDPYRTMDDVQRELRRKLRAQAKQLGDGESQTKRGAYEIKHLVEKIAYDQWHRLLFARYLLENNLLISPEHGVSVSSADCEELAPSLGLKDAWSVAARFAAKELPEIFRADDPAGAVDLPAEDRNPLIQLVTGLPVDVFTASDSLGWCYQFWQAAEKKTVNKSGKKIGADELPAVTQLFTEDYMVDFLLDNTLGAWHAGKALAVKPKLAETAQSEEELRGAVALPGVTWKYLRFIKGEDGKWLPAAGTFGGWPKTAKEINCLDPCMGSGHFIVAMFERLVALRAFEEKLDEPAAAAATIRDNLFGVEVDPRCTQIGAFNLALTAWRRVGFCKLPAMNLACSGVAPNAREADWLAIGGDDHKLKNGMERLYRLFKDAPILGSLIDPQLSANDMFVADYQELQPLLDRALMQESKDDTVYEMAVAARGLTKAAEILSRQFTLVATNVPYLGRGKQHDLLMDYCERVHPEAQADLATCFIERSIRLCANGGTASFVTKQEWLFLGKYLLVRRRSLEMNTWGFVARLGPRAFETISGERVTVSLHAITVAHPSDNTQFYSIDVTSEKTPTRKAIALANKDLAWLNQFDQLKNPDSRVTTEASGATGPTLGSVAESYQGIVTGDLERFRLKFFELPSLGTAWVPFRTTISLSGLQDGCHSVLLWEAGAGSLHQYAAETRERLHDMHESGNRAWSRVGIAINRMSGLQATVYYGEHFDNNVAVLIPQEQANIAALLAYCSSPVFAEQVKKLDRTLKVTNKTLVKVPFDLALWQRMAIEKYPEGLPKPFSSDPTHFLFNGHPKGAEQPLHVAVARLLGYQWPRQTGYSFSDCSPLIPDGLETLADADGIVCLSAAKGEEPGAERLRALLVRALGKFDLRGLIASAGPKGSKSETLDDWLREEFFEQHCVLFHHRPFIWHVWDGHKGGFSALMNYHQLTHANLEKLTYSYLGSDWIRRQQAAVETGEDGGDARLQAAKQLQAKLQLILEGEPPYDIFVRWKPRAKQAVGWHPDLNDGVLPNIRPFALANILRRPVKIMRDKDPGKEPVRDKNDFPWFWKGSEFTGDRVNDVHLSLDRKSKA